MAETLISPGVFLQENDLSQITSGPVSAGAALLGPTVTGPVNIPTYITSYSQYKAVFGAAFISGGNNYEYLTSMAALNYFEQGGSSLLVTRVASGSYTAATASIPCNVTSAPGTVASGYIDLSGVNALVTGSGRSLAIQDQTGNNNMYYVAGADWGFNYNYYQQTFDYGYFSPNAGSAYNVDQWGAALANFVNAQPELANLVSMSYDLGTQHLIISASSANTSILNFFTGMWVGQDPGMTSPTLVLSGGAAAISDAAFELETLSTGITMNNNGGMVTNGLLPSGSSANVRWEITQASTGSGTFSLIVRRGDDYNNSKTILESWNNLSLDPNQTNYISYIIGDQTQVVATDEFGSNYLQLEGAYANKSKYVRVKSVNKPTPNYFDTAGNVQSQYTASIPVVGSGSYEGTFGGATGAIWGAYGKAALNLFEAIPTVTYSTPADNIQGLQASDYNTAISLLSNQDAYDFNVIYAPGINNQNSPSALTALVQLAQTRGDNISVIDMVGFGQSMTEAKTQATSYDNSYAATYWPWVQVRSRETGKLNFVPASTLVPAIYEYNDKISAEWFAPAGLNRGGMATVLQPERRLSVNDRNYLYTGKVNPIATFPGVGTVVYGQKTLQAKPSALDRVNVRRLLISLKRYIKQVSENLVFEPNTQVTRNKFLNQVNPYLEFVQQKQGLYAFQVVMDETNNTPDVIDRNQLVGSIYLQPTRTAEFIQLDFNILPTGTSFGQ
jgi:phage tail sheath protein FI